LSRLRASGRLAPGPAGHRAGLNGTGNAAAAKKQGVIVSEKVAAGAEGDADRAADLKGILILFTVLVLGAVYFVSGWAPGI